MRKDFRNPSPLDRLDRLAKEARERAEEWIKSQEKEPEEVLGWKENRGLILTIFIVLLVAFFGFWAWSCWL